MKLASIALSGALVLAAPWQPVRAAHSYATCTGYVESLPATISTPGHWCLRRDLSIAQDSGAAITIVANNVTLDCNDFKLDGLSAGLDTLAFGVLAQERANTTVRRCVVRGFYVGVRLVGGGHLVEDNQLELLREGMSNLDARSRDIIRRRWLDSESKVTLQELADEYGVSAERIRQIEANALKKMRALFAA